VWGQIGCGVNSNRIPDVQRLLICEYEDEPIHHEQDEGDDLQLGDDKVFYKP
jgi:hypothetical protein